MKKRVQKINPLPFTIKYNVNKQLVQLQFDLEHITHEGKIVP
jgi:hypothetical protein